VVRLEIHKVESEGPGKLAHLNSILLAGYFTLINFMWIQSNHPFSYRKWR